MLLVRANVSFGLLWRMQPKLAVRCICFFACGSLTLCKKGLLLMLKHVHMATITQWICLVYFVQGAKHPLQAWRLCYLLHSIHTAIASFQRIDFGVKCEAQTPRQISLQDTKYILSNLILQPLVTIYAGPDLDLGHAFRQLQSLDTQPCTTGCPPSTGRLAKWLLSGAKTPDCHRLPFSTVIITDGM